VSYESRARARLCPTFQFEALSADTEASVGALTSFAVRLEMGGAIQHSKVHEWVPWRIKESRDLPLGWTQTDGIISKAHGLYGMPAKFDLAKGMKGVILWR
jgi:hypothetical protein